jgi:uncharacterized membrane protein YkvA (DUF1232 family)
MMTTSNKAISIDEYIENQARSMKAEDLRELRRFLPALAEKKSAALAQKREKLVRGIDMLAGLLPSAAVERATDPLPHHLAELGVAARYVLKGIDIIPDTLPELGLADDEWIVGRVMQRNPELRSSDQ